MKKGDIITGTIEDYSFPNKGSFFVAEGDEKKKITVKNALPGAEIEGRIIKKKSGKIEAVVTKEIKKSPLETKKPVCPHFYECGGCTYQTVAYTNQLKLKEKMVKDLLTPVVPDLPWEGILASPEQFQYRNKMEFTFGDAEKDGPLTLGLHRSGSTFDILEINGCAIVRNAWNEILKYTQKFFREKKVPFYHKMQYEGVLRFLVLRQSFADGGIMINLVTTTKHELEAPKKKKQIEKEAAENGVLNSAAEKKEEAPKLWIEQKNEILDSLHLPEYVAGLLALMEKNSFKSLNSYSKISGILYTEDDNPADTVMSDSTTLLYGEDFLIEEVLGLKFKISPFSFFQTNTRGCEVLYSKVREYVMSVYDNGQKKAGVIYDLYSGTGTIAQLMAPIADKVYGIEIIEEAVVAARDNAKLNKLKNCEFIAGDVLAKLDEIEEKPDFIIMDPPRDGCNPKALNKIIDYGVDNMVYISCKPTSLARDLVTLQERGYRVVKACAVDEFPNTQHVETVCLLSRKAPV